MGIGKKFKGVAKDFINAMKTQFIGRGADPNDIFIQDLYNFQGTSNIQKNINWINNLSDENKKVLENLLSVYNENIESKRQLLEQSRQLFQTDIVQTVIDVMIDDGFNSFYNEKEEFRIEYTLDEEDKKLLGDSFQKEVQNLIDDFINKFALKSKVADIVPELLRDGEYAFGVLFENEKGITEIVDDLDVINLLPFYEGDKVSFVMYQKDFKDKNNMAPVSNELPKFYDADNIIFFNLKGPTKKRINLSLFYDTNIRKKFLEETHIRLPKYVRTPVPIYYGAMKNLSRLQLMENVSTVLDLQSVIKPEIVTVTVPANTSPTEAAQIVRDYERRLNSTDNFVDNDSLDFSTMASQSVRKQVLPQWSDSKGTINTSEVGQSHGDKSNAAWTSINNVRNLIALSIGIPPFFINMSEQPQEKAQIIKLYSRYTRKLTSLQKSLADGVKDIIFLHLKKCGVIVKKDNISVKFKTITSGDSLDDTDMMVATVTGINELYKGIEEITSSDNNNLVFNDAQFKQLFDNLTSKYLNISNLISISEQKFKDNESEMSSFEDDGFEPIHNFERENISTQKPEKINEPEEDVYNNFASSQDNIEIEGPQEIETERTVEPEGEE